MLESKKTDKNKKSPNAFKKPEKTASPGDKKSDNVNDNHNAKKVSLGANTKR